MSNDYGRALREARGSTSRVALAVRVGVDPSTIYRIEHGQVPTLRVELALRAWCRDLPRLER